MSEERKPEFRVHPTLEKIADELASGDIVAIEGYVGSVANGKTRLYRNLRPNVGIEVPTSAILHLEEIPGDDSGKVRAYMEASVRSEWVVRAPASTAQPASDASGAICLNGTLYCWTRIRSGDTVVIVMEPCGSCPEEPPGGIGDIVP